MIITHLAVSGVGRFRTRHEVKGFGPGLNLLCAPNEHGKSTLFRALHTCLFARHSSATEDIRALATLGAQLPVAIEVGFERDGVRYAVQKSFVHSRSCCLLRNGDLIAEGRPADDEVWKILGVHESGRSVDESTFGLLWVRQGDSFKPGEPSETARSTLNRLIEAEVGQVLGGQRGERVSQSVGAQLAEEETAGGRAKAGGAWKRAQDAEEKARADLAAVRATLTQLDANLQTLDGLLKRQRILEDPAALAEMRAQSEQATRELAAAQSAQALAQTAEAEAQRAALAWELAQRRAQEMGELDRRIAASRKRVEQLAGELAGFDEAQRAGARTVAEGETRLAETAAALDEAERTCDRLNRLAVAAASAAGVAELRSRLEEARKIRERLAVVAATLSKDGLSAAQLRRIESLAGDLDIKHLQREAKAPQVAIALGPEASGRVRLQGDVIERSQQVAAVGPLQIDIAGIASIQIVPVAAPEDASAVEAAQETLARELRKTGTLSLADARERRVRTEELEDERRTLTANLDAKAPTTGGQDGIAALERRLAAALAPLDGLSEDDLRDVAQQPDRLAARRTQADVDRDECRKKQAQAQTALAAARSDHAAREFQRTACRNELASERAMLDRDLETAPDEQRPGMLDALVATAAEAQRAASDAQANAAALRAAVPSEEDRASLAARAKRLAEAIAGREAELQQVNIAVATLRERVAAHGGQGLGEREAALAEELAMAERESARIERRLGALRLLRDTMDACRNEARDAYLAPIKRGMQPFLHALFPGAEAQFDQGFGIESLRRNAPDPEPFAFLSEGTREQIAVMVRLAFGGLLAARGQPAPVLLDDALVFSDDDRIERMFDVLTQAAEKHQVIVLTCRDRAFQTFGGQRLTIAAG
jgi:DNA repair exonuclease SbcCD ATPase subunit